MKAMVSHLIITIHIHYRNCVAGEHLYSKLSQVDLPASKCLLEEDANRDDVTDCLHVSKSLSALGDTLASLSAKKEPVLSGNSRFTQILADSLARNAELSLGNRDTIKKWKDVANDARKELLEKEKEVSDLRQEVSGLKLSLKEANDQCTLLFNEVQKASGVSSTLQNDLKSENLMLADKHKIEKEQNNQLPNWREAAKLEGGAHEQGWPASSRQVGPWCHPCPPAPCLCATKEGAAAN